MIDIGYQAELRRIKKELNSEIEAAKSIHNMVFLQEINPGKPPAYYLGYLIALQHVKQMIDEPEEE